MGQFFKFLLASCLGVLIAVFVLIGIGSLVLAGLASEATRVEEVRPNTVLHLTFSDPVPEKTNNLEMNPFNLQSRKVLGLHEIVRTLEEAREDDNVKGLFLELENFMASGVVTVSSLRDAVRDFRDSGKFVVAYSKFYTQGAYYVASTADSIYLNPIGLVDFRGFAAQIPYFKDLLDKVGIEMQIFYAGQYKSATEPYRLTGMSEQNRRQTREYLSTMYDDFLRDVSASRGVPVEQLDQAANSYQGGIAEQAKAAGLVDVVGYRDQALSEVRRRLGLDEDDKIPLVTLQDYNANNPPHTDYSQSDKIAVVYAEGTILDGEGDNGSTGDQKYTNILRKLRRDDKVKAIVLRVNSPGGSALASENIWREVTLAKAEGKPVVVSMGDYAASGGYYIACAADSIFAEEKTLTGSIGVFSMIPSAQELLNQKLGIHFDTVLTADFAAGISPFYDMNERERTFMQNRTDLMYETFLARVAEGRGMSRDSVDEIAQGRVWTGIKAREMGLVDRIGGLEEAVASAATLAGLEGYRISEYPQVKDPLQELIEEALGQDEGPQAHRLWMRTLGSEYAPYVKLVEELARAKGVQARLPFVVSF